MIQQCPPKGPRTSRAARGAGALLSVVLSVVGSGTISASSSEAAGVGAVDRSCRSMQIIDWLGPPMAPIAANRNYEAHVYFENIGRTCSLALTYVGVVPTSGAAHHWLTSGSVTPTVALLGRIVMKPGARVSAVIFIDSIDSVSFRQLVKTHGGRCDPRPADGIGVFGLYRGWPITYFALPRRISVCTSDYLNVAASVIGPVAWSASLAR